MSARSFYSGQRFERQLGTEAWSSLGGPALAHSPGGNGASPWPYLGCLLALSIAVRYSGGNKVPKLGARREALPLLFSTVGMEQVHCRTWDVNSLLLLR